MVLHETPLRLLHLPTLTLLVAQWPCRWQLRGVPPSNEGHSLSVLLDDGTGRFTHAHGTPLLLPGMISTLATGDLNGDGAPELVEALTDLGLSISRNKSPRLP